MHFADHECGVENEEMQMALTTFSVEEPECKYFPICSLTPTHVETRVKFAFELWHAGKSLFATSAPVKSYVIIGYIWGICAFAFNISTATLKYSVIK